MVKEKYWHFRRCGQFYTLFKFHIDILAGVREKYIKKSVRTDSTAKVRFHIFHSHFFVTQKTSTAKKKFWLCQLLKTSTARKNFWLCRLLKTSTAKNFSTNHSQVRRSIANQKLFAQQIKISEFLSSD